MTRNCFGVIRVQRDLEPGKLHITLVHELGHLLNGDSKHSDDPWSVMFWKYTSSDMTISDADVERVLARL